eukprot:Sspe_Gene.28020::Locus_12445_Transcript_1_2_Confidence_0.750_Length_1671::g.28020::m.28020
MLRRVKVVWKPSTLTERAFLVSSSSYTMRTFSSWVAGQPSWFSDTRSPEGRVALVWCDPYRAKGWSCTPRPTSPQSTPAPRGKGRGGQDGDRPTTGGATVRTPPPNPGQSASPWGFERGWVGRREGKLGSGNTGGYLLTASF